SVGSLGCTFDSAGASRSVTGLARSASCSGLRRALKPSVTNRVASIARAAARRGRMELSYPMDTLQTMPMMPAEVLPWSADQVLALAPDASAQRAARGLAGDKPWLETAVSTGDDLPPTVWGLCQGSGSTPYQTAIDLTEPAFKCNCPSRKLPCKHALALLLRWSSGSIPDGSAPA